MTLTALILAAAASQGAQPQEPTVTVEAGRILPSVGLMNDHMHAAGEFMAGLRYQHFEWSGAYRQGAHSLGDADLLADGYMMRARSMHMDMAMLDLMYGISDALTVTVSPQYVWNRMTVVGIDPMGAMNGGMMVGETARASTHGFGDTPVAASFRLKRGEHLNAHLTLGAWAPTGRAKLKNPDGSFTEYDMQTGSGTWDLEPSATLTGQQGAVGWGAQAGYRLRAERRNDAGYRLGNRALLTGWLSYRLAAPLEATARAEYTHQGRIHGMYNGPASMGMPEDAPANTGGSLLVGAAGLNWKPALGMQRGPQIGVELGVPIHQRVNGVQLLQKWQASVATRYFF